MSKYFDDSAGKDFWAVMWRFGLCLLGMAAFVGILLLCTK